MDLPDFKDEDHYNAVARFFHWAIAFLIVFLLGLGLTMGDINFGVPRHTVYDLHKSLGLLVLLLAAGRIVWRFASVPPDALDTHAAWERLLAKAAHAFLYFAMVAMPLTGWLMSDAAGRSPTFFGLPVPRLLENSDDLRGIFGAAHEFLAYGLIAVIGMHVAGALKHHIIDRDATLRRMAGDRLGWFKGVAALLFIDVLLSAGAFLYLKDRIMPQPEATVQEQAAATPAIDLSALAPHGWAIDQAVSHITFESSAMGQGFTGSFGYFDGDIVFDPENTAASRVDIAIKMDQIATGDAERDGMLLQTDWFSVAQFAESRFVTRTIEHLGDNRYMAVGDLTIRDITMPVSLPFTLDIKEEGERRVAYMQGKLTVNRLDFGVGQGEWAGVDAVPANVAVSVQVKALQPL